MAKKNKLELVLSSNIIFPNGLKSEVVNLNSFGFTSATSAFDSSGYTICNELAKSCGNLSYFPQTNTFVFTDASFCQMVDNDMFVNNVSKALGISSRNRSSRLCRQNGYFCSNGGFCLNGRTYTNNGKGRRRKWIKRCQSSAVTNYCSSYTDQKIIGLSLSTPSRNLPIINNFNNL